MTVVSSGSLTLFETLANNLAQLACDGYLVADTERRRYVQVWLRSDHVQLETVSNRYLFDEVALPLTGRDEVALARMGWHCPHAEGRPNWWRDIDLSSHPRWIELASDLLGRTLITVHRWQPGRTLTFEKGIRRR